MNPTYGSDGRETCALCSEPLAAGQTAFSVASNPDIELALEHGHIDYRRASGRYNGETKEETEARLHVFSKVAKSSVNIAGGLGAKHAAHPSDCLAFVIQGYGAELYSDREYLTHDAGAVSEYVTTLCSNGFTARVTEYLGSFAGATTTYEPVRATE